MASISGSITLSISRETICCICSDISADEMASGADILDIRSPYSRSPPYTFIRGYLGMSDICYSCVSSIFDSSMIDDLLDSFSVCFFFLSMAS